MYWLLIFYWLLVAILLSKPNGIELKLNWSVTKFGEHLKNVAEYNHTKFLLRYWNVSVMDKIHEFHTQAIQCSWHKGQKEILRQVKVKNIIKRTYKVHKIEKHCGSIPDCSFLLEHRIKDHRAIAQIESSIEPEIHFHLKASTLQWSNSLDIIHNRI